MGFTTHSHQQTPRGKVAIARSVVFVVLASLATAIMVSMSGAAAHAASAPPIDAPADREYGAPADREYGWPADREYGVPADREYGGPGDREYGATDVIEVMEETYPYRNDDEEFDGILNCRADAGTYLQLGAQGWQCRNNTLLSRIELWIQWPSGCPSCPARETL